VKRESENSVSEMRKFVGIMDPSSWTSQRLKRIAETLIGRI
jgi:hypothetical protein